MNLTFDRRALLKSAGAAAVGLSAIAQAAAPRRKYANVGVGSRSRMYLTAITKTFPKDNELVGICDTNPGRLDTALNFIKPNLAKTGIKPPKKYLAADFDKMIKETQAGLRHRHLPRWLPPRIHRARAGRRAATCSPRSR